MKSLKHNAVMNTILSISTIVFPLITYPYVARVLGVEMNGRLSFAQSTINYFSLFATLGITTYGIKACAQVRDSKEKLSRRVQELLIINIITTVVVFVALVASIMLVPKFNKEWMLLIIYSLNIILNYSQYLFGIFNLRDLGWVLISKQFDLTHNCLKSRNILFVFFNCGNDFQL